MRIGSAAIAMLVICFGSTQAGEPAKRVSSEKKWWDVPDVDARTRPGDKFKRTRGGEGARYNASLLGRRCTAADAVLKKLEKQWHKKTPKELIELFCCPETPDWPDSVSYHVASSGNKLIEAELKSRGEAARAALEGHLKDDRNVFDGVAGGNFPVRIICADILGSLSSPKHEKPSKPQPKR